MDNEETAVPPLRMWGDPTRGRQCGTCQACCVIVPVMEIAKPAATRCKHQFSRGCRIYATRPTSCAWWSCRWLFDPEAAELRRPDQSGYVVDPMMDRLVVDGTVMDAFQVWVDPKRPDAHRAPELRSYLARAAGGRRLPVIVRFPIDGGERTGKGVNIVLVAPGMHDSGDGWLEFSDDRVNLGTRAEMEAHIRATRAARPPIPQSAS